MEYLKNEQTFVLEYLKGINQQKDYVNLFRIEKE